MLSLALIYLAIYFIDPQKARWIPACPFYSLTGFYCPGCGLLRSFHQLAHGNLSQALTFNLPAVVSVPLVVGSIAIDICDLLGFRSHRWPVISNQACWIVAIVIIIYGVARNIPIYPLYLLAPH
ncbi:DUF2752 domain-containing protein [bacterium]|nr:DUF2752 domain-containing protein [bacterium]